MSTKHLSTIVPMQLQGEEVATTQKHHQKEGMELDLKIWSLLLEHLLENILVWLLLLSLFVLHTVCKQWNTFTYSPSFLAILARVPPLKQAWFLFRRDGKESVAYNPEDANRKIGWWCATPCPKHGHRYVPTLSAKLS